MKYIQNRVYININYLRATNIISQRIDKPQQACLFTIICFYLNNSKWLNNHNIS